MWKMFKINNKDTRTLIPAISHLLKFGVNPKKEEKMWKLITISFVELTLSEKRLFHQHMQNIGSSNQKWLTHPFIQGFSLIRRNIISSAKMNRNAEIRFPWRGPLLSLKYFVFILPSMTHDSNCSKSFLSTR